MSHENQNGSGGTNPEMQKPTSIHGAKFVLGSNGMPSDRPAKHKKPEHPVKKSVPPENSGAEAGTHEQPSYYEIEKVAQEHNDSRQVQASNEDVQPLRQKDDYAEDLAVEEPAENEHKKKLSKVFATILIAAIFLIIVAYAIGEATLLIENNIFQSGNMSVQLSNENGDPDVPIVDCDRLIEKLVLNGSVGTNFIVKNTGTLNFKYKIFFENVEGNIQDQVLVSIHPKDDTSGRVFRPLSEITSKDPAITGQMNATGLDAVQAFTIDFIWPADQTIPENEKLKFDIRVTVGQVNMPDNLF